MCDEMLVLARDLLKANAQPVNLETPFDRISCLKVCVDGGVERFSPFTSVVTYATSVITDSSNALAALILLTR